MENNFSIPKPCHEDWDGMMPLEHGRYCGNCCKAVMDFTNWAADDIRLYLQNQKKAVCGRFNQEQIVETPPLQLTQMVEQVGHSRISFLRKVAAIIILCFGLGATSEIQAQNRMGKVAAPVSVPSKHVTGEIAIFKDTVPPPKPRVITIPDSVKQKPQIMGLIAPYPPSPPKKDGGLKSDHISNRKP